MNRRLRIAHVVLQLDTGGMEKLLVEFGRHADRDRFELQFVSLGPRGNIADELEALNWQVRALNEPPGRRPGLWPRLAWLFRDIDIVHLHNIKPMIYGAPAAWLARVKGVIYTRHGPRHPEGRRAEVAFRLAARACDRVVGVSSEVARMSIAQGVPAAKVCAIWNGIDVSRFAYAGPRPSGSVVMVARLAPEKDAATLIRAAVIVSKHFPELRVEIAGTGPSAASLQELVTELGAEEYVHLLGYVADVPALLSRAQMMVLPSRFEGLPLALIEAGARGLPVIASNIGGNNEVVVPNSNGLLFTLGSAEDLAAAMLTLLRDPVLGERMGRAGRQRVETEFRSERMVADYEALYLSCAAGHDSTAIPTSAAASL